MELLHMRQQLMRELKTCIQAVDVLNEETEDHPDIYVCGPPKAGWPEFWKDLRYYG